MSQMKDKSCAGKSMSFDLNAAVADSANQYSGSLSQTPQESSLSETSSRNAVITGDDPILRISDDGTPGEHGLSHFPSFTNADQSLPTLGIPRQTVGNSSPRSSDSSRMARQTGYSSGDQQVDNNPLNNNPVPLNANSQEFASRILQEVDPGVYLYDERPQGYFYPSFEGGQNPVQFNAHATMNGPLPYEFHHQQYFHPTWFNGFPMGLNPSNMPPITLAGPFTSSDFYQWTAFPGFYQPNNFEHFPWFPFHQDGLVSYAQHIDLVPCIHHTRYGYFLEERRIPNQYFPGGPRVQQTSQAMEVPINPEDLLIPEFDDVIIMYADEGIRSHHPESLFMHQNSLNNRHQGLRYDVDNMIYEELLALQEFIGNVNVGLRAETIMQVLKRKYYESDSNDPERCCICLQDYAGGEEIGTLDCGHEFHPDCIKMWLEQKNECPICKKRGLGNK